MYSSGVLGSARRLAVGQEMGWFQGVLAEGRAGRGSREPSLYLDFLSFRLGLDAKPRFRQGDTHLLGGSKRQEPHKTTLFLRCEDKEEAWFCSVVSRARADMFIYVRSCPVPRTRPCSGLGKPNSALIFDHRQNLEHFGFIAWVISVCHLRYPHPDMASLRL